MIGYLISVVVFFLLLLGYFQLAEKYKIIDKPNERSSHKGVVIRGGGIIFVFGLLYPLIFQQDIPWFFILGFVLISVVSFVDDIYDLSTKPRMAAQFISVYLMLYQLEFLGLSPWYSPVFAVLFVATINAYNFMDGINGINGLFSMSALGALAWMNSSYQFVSDDSLRYLILAVLVFGFFNFRSKAKCFSGDVGSVSLAFALLFFTVSLILKTGDVSFILFLLLYGVDTLWTVVQRFLRGDKITEAHRLHLFQLMSNELKMPHLLVSSIYFVVQSLFSILIVYNHKNHVVDPLLFTGVIIIASSFIYWAIKFPIIKKIAA